MTSSLLRIGLTVGLGILSFVQPLRADDAKLDSSSTPKPPVIDKSKAPDFSGYTSVATVMGEVVKSDDKNLTIRLFWQVATPKKTRNRPQLHTGNGQSAANPFTRRQQIQVKWEHHDYTLDYLPESLVRTKTLPPKFDADGKKSVYTEAQRDELKVPYSVVGYQASKSDLTPGTVVELFVVRDKTIAAAKVAESDMRIKYAVIFGQDPTPPKDIANAGTSGKK